ncbi:MAG: hypothetical protein ACI4AI_05050 [Paludibacteraceae bacterium]
MYDDVMGHGWFTSTNGKKKSPVKPGNICIILMVFRALISAALLLLTGLFSIPANCRLSKLRVAAM